MCTFAAVSEVSQLLSLDLVLQHKGVSVGHGMLIDWRTIKCGDTLLERADTFDCAQLFVALLGVEEAREAVRAKIALE